MMSYLKNRDLMRSLRLVSGIFITVQGVFASEWQFIVLGGLFSLMSLLNIGCCGASDCNMPIQKSVKKIEDVSYDEVH